MLTIALLVVCAPISKADTYADLTTGIPGMTRVWSTAWNGSTWLIGGSGTNILYSYDGTDFTNLSSHVPGMSDVYSVAWNSATSTWLIGGDGASNNAVLYSLHGSTYSQLSSSYISNMSYIWRIATNGSTWLIGGGDNSPGQLPVLLSYDGGMGYTPLTSHIPNLDSEIDSIAWNGSTWLIGGYGTSCLYSYDGDSTYTDLSSYLPDNNLTIIGMAWNGSEWLLGGDSGNNSDKLFSYDGGTTFTDLTSEIPIHVDRVNSVAWNGSTWLIGGVASGPSPRLISYNGTNFADLSSNVTGLGDIFSVADNGSTWLIGGGWSGQPSTLYSLFSVTNPAPTLTYLGPNSAAAGSPAVHLNIMGTNFIPSSQVQWNGTALSTDYVDGTHIHATVPAADLVNPGAFAVTVFNPPPGGGASSPMTFTVSKSGPDLSTWYLAEGTNAWGFSTYISIENPNDSAVTAKLTYMDPNAPASGKGIAGTRTITLPPLSQTTVSSMSDIGAVDFSTKVECLEGKSIAVDRTMFWTGPGYSPSQSGYHSSIGATSPAKTWYLPEGSSNWGFETWTLVENPNPTAAQVTLTYMTQDQGPKVLKKNVPAYSRASYNMASDIGNADSSIQVSSDIPVVAEGSVYKNNRREGSCSIGATTPSNDYFLAEGATGYNVGFTTYILVQNPHSTPTNVTLTYQTQSGQVAGPSFTMGPDSRKTIRVNDTLPANTNVSTRVHGSQPIIAERAMYWDNGTGTAFHASIGLPSPHMTFYLPDGQTSNGWETWTLVENPNPGAVTVRVTYLPQGGGKTVSFTDEIAPNTRSTYSMADKIPSGRASIKVQSLDGARPIMVERSMYMNNRGAGTNTIGAYSD